MPPPPPMDSGNNGDYKPEIVAAAAVLAFAIAGTVAAIGLAVLAAHLLH